MKTTERHRLKKNEVAVTLGQVRESVVSNRKPIATAVVAILVLAGLGGGYWFWRNQQLSQASTLLAEARTVANAPIAAAPEAAAPAAPAPAPVAGTFRDEAARREAALKKFDAAADAYPATSPGLAARFQAASLRAEMGNLAEAEKGYQDVIARDATGLYGRMARLGVAALQVRTSKFEPAIRTFSELSQRTDTDLPVDGILMQLAEAYRLAGRVPDAVRTYTRISDEFPDSPFAADAKTEADRLKAGASPRS